MKQWERLQQLSEQARDNLSRLYRESNDARCRFQLAARGGGPVGAWDEFRCVRDRHDDDQHELADETWMEIAR